MAPAGAAEDQSQEPGEGDPAVDGPHVAPLLRGIPVGAPSGPTGHPAFSSEIFPCGGRRNERNLTVVAEHSLVATLFLTGALAVGAMAPAASAQPVITGGLVNITVVDVLNNNTVTLDRTVNVALALGIAANVCDVTAGVLAQQLNAGSATCQNALDGVTATINQP